MHKHPVGTTVEIISDVSDQIRDAHTASLRMQLAAAQDKDPTGTVQTNSGGLLEATLMTEPKMNKKDNVWVYWANIIGTNIDVPLRQDHLRVISLTENIYVGYNKLPNFKRYIEFTKW